MLTDLMIEEAAWEAVDLEEIAERAALAALAHHELAPADWEIAVLACNDARIAELNAEFREKPTPTNVLSWPAEDLAPDEAGEAPYAPTPDPMEPGATPLGDIAIAWETCLREAEAGGIPLTDHLTHLILHATLHLLGYDHIRDEDATLMETIETGILGKMGIPDPYSRDAG
ncbi:rRNA maturation RNase YbeY [Pseudooceanicola nanhaiensis]|uniref:rRNA maturation RNase YbeY n=1 Tax=Pseudooceanicola nanhaiensis TaxID=375761 RepID=UPI001CD70D46|nr:rRNA maturation RNase YbeY [Pseudooceanicola nanhaiensis]MCA0922458.1 rRNA maturation RNase YbeY [Pseudooceanicola nanhaiensis]